MIRRALHQYTPGTIRARTRGVQAIMRGRPDLLKPSLMLNATRGYGVTTLLRTGVMTVGDNPLRMNPHNKRRQSIRIVNVTHLNANGTENSDWAYINGTWQTPAYQTRQYAKLAFAFGRIARSNDNVIDIAKAQRYGKNTAGDLSILPVGTAGTRVRYLVEEITNHGVW